MQYIISKIAWVMVRLMSTSGAESVVAAASPFVGQGESALLVKPFIKYMTSSELHSTMCSGFSTIAGSVLLAYQSFLGDTSSILTACVMSVPASLAVSKIRVPETEESLTKGTVSIPESEEVEANFLHAATNGASVGVHLVYFFLSRFYLLAVHYSLSCPCFIWLILFLAGYSTCLIYMIPLLDQI